MLKNSFRSYRNVYIYIILLVVSVTASSDFFVFMHKSDIHDVEFNFVLTHANYFLHQMSIGFPTIEVFLKKIFVNKSQKNFSFY